jgi:hypothetical protein
VESDTQKSYPLYVVKPWRVGTQRTFPLYKALLENLDFDLDNPDEMLIIRVHPPYLTMRVAKPERLVPIENWDPAVLPPAWPHTRAKVDRT